MTRSARRATAIGPSNAALNPVMRRGRQPAASATDSSDARV